MPEASDREDPVLVQTIEPPQFGWRTVLILTALYVAGNLLSIPRLIEQGTPVPSPVMMLVFTTLMLGVLAAGQLVANKVGLRAPLIDGQLRGRDALVGLY